MTRNRAVPYISDEDRAFLASILIHEDDHVLAFDKPAGLPTQVRGNKARNLDHLLWAFAKSNGKRPRLVHRLDAGTSGVILVGKTQPAAAALSAAFAGRTARKTYLALVAGPLPAADQGEIDAPIARLEHDRGDEMIVGHADGKSAQTGWRILARAGFSALMELSPRTGRMHQLRLHMAHIGCPILGDDRYGGRKASRMMLHAARITLPHPSGSGELTVEAPLPHEMRDAGIALGLNLPIAGAAQPD